MYNLFFILFSVLFLLLDVSTESRDVSIDRSSSSCVSKESILELLSEDENMRLDDPRVLSLLMLPSGEISRGVDQTEKIEGQSPWTEQTEKIERRFYESPSPTPRTKQTEKRRFLNTMSPTPTPTPGFEHFLEDLVGLSSHPCGLRNQTNKSACQNYIGVRLNESTSYSDVILDDLHCEVVTEQTGSHSTRYCSPCEFVTGTKVCEYRCNDLDYFVDTTGVFCQNLGGCKYLEPTGCTYDTYSYDDTMNFGDSSCDSNSTLCVDELEKCRQEWTDSDNHTYGCDVMINCWNNEQYCTYLEFQPLADEQSFERQSGANIKRLYNGVFTPLTQLRDINFAYNFLQNLNESSFMNLSLYFLNLNANLLSDLNFLFSCNSRTTLRELYLVNNNIAVLKNEVFNMESLEELYLTENIISTIHPDAFDASQLTILDLSSNRIEMLSRDVFNELPRLEVLNLANNQLTGVQSSLISQNLYLNWLSLANNKIFTLPTTFFNGKSRDTLERVYLNGNAIRTLSTDMFIKHGLLNVDLLDLSSNPITVIENDSIHHLVCSVSEFVMSNSPSFCKCSHSRQIECTCHHSTVWNSDSRSCTSAVPTQSILTCSNESDVGCVFDSREETGHNYGVFDCESELSGQPIDLNVNSTIRPSTLGGDSIRWVNFFQNSVNDIVRDGDYFVVIDEQFATNGSCLVDSENGVDLLCTSIY